MKNKSLAPSVVTSRDPKGRKFMQIVEGAYNKARLLDGPVGTPEGEAQRVNEAPGLADLVYNFIQSHRVSKLYAGEEVSSKYGYLSGYNQPKAIGVQIEILKRLIPGLGDANARLVQLIQGDRYEVPAEAEGFFAIPNIWKRGKPSTVVISSVYSECVQAVLNLIKTTRNGKFYNCREGQIDEAHLRELAKTKSAMEAISEAQGNPDILIIAAQFGLRHRGRSVRRAHVVMKSGEFGLGAFAIGCMLLTHPERLQHHDDLWIDLAGDEWSPDGDGGFSFAPCFGGGVWFDASCVDYAVGYYGSASGFTSQQQAV